MTWEGGLTVGEDMVTVDGRRTEVGVAGRPVGDGRGTVGKGGSNCSKGEGFTHCWGRGVLFVFVFWGERET
jgi:hypothetical protein